MLFWPGPRKWCMILLPNWLPFSFHPLIFPFQESQGFLLATQNVETSFIHSTSIYLLNAYYLSWRTEVRTLMPTWLWKTLNKSFMAFHRWPEFYSLSFRKPLESPGLRMGNTPPGRVSLYTKWDSSSCYNKLNYILKSKSYKISWPGVDTLWCSACGLIHGS